MRTDFAMYRAHTTLERLCFVVQLLPYAISERNCFDMCRHLMNINEQCGISQLILSDRYFNSYDPCKQQCANQTHRVALHKASNARLLPPMLKMEQR